MRRSCEHDLGCGVVVNRVNIKWVKESFVSTIDQERVVRHVVKKGCKGRVIVCHGWKYWVLGKCELSSLLEKCYRRSSTIEKALSMSMQWG